LNSKTNCVAEPWFSHCEPGQASKQKKKESFSKKL
jgi:hypothetical protein